MSKEIKVIVSYIEKHGFQLVRQNKHYVFKLDEHTLTLSKTPNCPHVLHNVKRDLRKMNITPLEL